MLHVTEDAMRRSGQRTSDDRLDLVSFDVFDTLVCRAVAAPTDVFRLVQEESGGFLPPSFAADRERAESLARASAAREGREEVTLAEIYDALVASGSLPRRMADGAMEMEVAAEERLCRPRPDVQRLLAAHLEAGRRVIAISDMYLPGEAVRAILRRCGYAGLADVVVSSEEGVTKHTGRLFARVLAREGVLPSRWLHVGDNPRADGGMARKLGIRTLHTPLPAPHEGWRNGDGSLADGIIERAARLASMGEGANCDTTRFWQAVGAEVAAPMVVGLCHEVRRRARETGASRIYFLARDGAVIKAAYEALFPGERTRHVYLHASRRVINFAAIEALDDSAIRYLKGGKHLHTVAELLARVGIRDADIARRALEAAGLAQDGPNPPSDLLERGLRAVGDEILEAARAERAVLTDYLTSEGLFAGGDALVVDVGWNCSIQRSLVRMVEGAGSTTSLHGVYVGTKSGVYQGTPALDASGWLYHAGGPFRARNEVERCIEFVELLFAAPEHGIVGIARDGEGFVPIRFEAPDEEGRIEVAALIHAAVLAVCDRIRDAGLVDSCDPGREAVLRRLTAFLRKPDEMAAETLGAIRHSMGFGASQYSPFVTLPSSWRSPADVMRAMVRSFWREAFPLSAPRRIRPLVGLAIKVIVPAYRRAAQLKYRLRGA